MDLFKNFIINNNFEHLFKCSTVLALNISLMDLFKNSIINNNFEHLFQHSTVI